MKYSKEKFIKLLKAMIISARGVQDEKESKGDYERADYWKKKRWILEDLLEMIEDPKAFEREYKFYSSLIEEIEEL